MSNQVHCNCQRCTIRGLRGPVIVVTIGVLFLLQEMRGGYFDFSNTYPVILIVIGLVSLACALASSEGHVSSAPLPPAVPPPQGIPPAPAGPAPTAYPGQGQ
ncbi:MAG: LiaI-LiaF-like domain-containing protein [Candidatus Acidiferrum sp.]